jgi:hypothetical protein
MGAGRDGEDGWAARLAARGVDLVDGEARAGGVVFSLPRCAADEDARAFADALARLAARLEGEPRLGGASVVARLFGRGGERRYAEAARLAGFGPPLRGAAVVVDGEASLAWPDRPRVGLDADGVTLERVVRTWVTSHDKGYVSEPYARVPKEALPFDVDAFVALVELASAATIAYATGGGDGVCAVCGEAREALDLVDGTTCHACAAARDGRIH